MWYKYSERNFCKITEKFTNRALVTPTQGQEKTTLFATWLTRWPIPINKIDGLVQDCSNSSALAMELLQSCTKPWKCACNISRNQCDFHMPVLIWETLTLPWNIWSQTEADKMNTCNKNDALGKYQVQSGAVIIWSNISWHHKQHRNAENQILNSEKTPLHGWTMTCLSWGCWRKSHLN